MLIIHFISLSICFHCRWQHLLVVVTLLFVILMLLDHSQFGSWHGVVISCRQLLCHKQHLRLFFCVTAWVLWPLKVGLFLCNTMPWSAVQKVNKSTFWPRVQWGMTPIYGSWCHLIIIWPLTHNSLGHNDLHGVKVKVIENKIHAL